MGNLRARCNQSHNGHDKMFVMANYEYYFSGQPAEVVPAGKNFAVAAIFNKTLKGLFSCLVAAGLPVMLNIIYPDAAICFRE